MSLTEKEKADYQSYLSCMERDVDGLTAELRRLIKERDDPEKLRLLNSYLNISDDLGGVVSALMLTVEHMSYRHFNALLGMVSSALHDSLFECSEIQETFIKIQANPGPYFPFINALISRFDLKYHSWVRGFSVIFGFTDYEIELLKLIEVDFDFGVVRQKQAHQIILQTLGGEDFGGPCYVTLDLFIFMAKIAKFFEIGVEVILYGKTFCKSKNTWPQTEYGIQVPLEWLESSKNRSMPVNGLLDRLKKEVFGEINSVSLRVPELQDVSEKFHENLKAYIEECRSINQRGGWLWGRSDGVGVTIVDSKTEPKIISPNLSKRIEPGCFKLDDVSIYRNPDHARHFFRPERFHDPRLVRPPVVRVKVDSGAASASAAASHAGFFPTEAQLSKRSRSGLGDPLTYTDKETNKKMQVTKKWVDSMITKSESRVQSDKDEFSHYRLEKGCFYLVNSRWAYWPGYRNGYDAPICDGGLYYANPKNQQLSSYRR